jgi:hypothetical protein
MARPCPQDGQARILVAGTSRDENGERVGQDKSS